MSLSRTFYTVRHLKYTQIAAQLRNRLRPYWERPDAFFQRGTPDFGGCRWPESIEFLPPGAQLNDGDAILRGDYTFLNQTGTLGWPPSDWNAPSETRLWQYNLHYFEWLWALDYPAARQAILDWIARHPLSRGQIGWEPYPTSLRLMNWAGVCFGKYRQETLDDQEFRDALWRSTTLQADWLAGHLETHLKGNHLFENGAALAFAGSCFTGTAAQRWLNTGLGVLRRELPEQILGDGMHFERSPMYHARLTYLVKLLCDTDDPTLKALLGPHREPMEQALTHLCHPDGQIALFNDSAFGIYNELESLRGPDQQEAHYGPWALADAGYYGWRGEDGTYLICDAAPIGPDYLPGHAHGDMLSFELSLRGHRVLVDSGTHGYEAGPMRAYCRSTRAHNTVEVENLDQCEFWGQFRVARRGQPRDVSWEAHTNGFTLSAWHDGYRRIPGRPVHHRTFTWDKSQGLTIRDRVKAGRPVKTATRFHLHPGCRIIRLGRDHAEVAYPAGRFSITFSGAGLLSCEDAQYCPEFGRLEPNNVLVYTHDSELLETVAHLHFESSPSS